MNDLNNKGEFKLEKDQLEKIKDNFSAESMSDNETKSIINEIYKKEKILIDPHTAVGIGATKKLQLENNAVILATAHPSKFSDVVMKETNTMPELPENLENILTNKEKYIKLTKDLKNIKDFILEKI